MQRYFFILLFLLVLVAPFIVRGWVGTEAASVNNTGGPELVIVTPHNQDIRHTFAAAFSDWHQSKFGSPVRVTYLTPGGTNDIIRLLNDLYGAQRNAKGELPPENQVKTSIDLAWGGGDTTFDRELKPILKPVSLDPSVLRDAFPKPDINGVMLYEQTKNNVPPRWVGVVLSTFGIVYSPVLFDRLHLAAPQKWDDLTRPELAGMLALTDPTRSGSAAMAYMMPLQRAMVDAEEAFLAAHAELKGKTPAELSSNAEYQSALASGWKKGMRTLLLMAANVRYFGDGGPQPCNDVGSGDAAAGIVIDFFARVFENQIGSQRIRYVAPASATAITPDPIAVLYGVQGEREMIANRFIQFLLSADGQKLWNLKSGASPYVPRSLRRLPIRRDVYADRSQWADDENPFDQANGFNVRQDWMRFYSDIRPLWSAAWIDSHSSLKEAYETILRDPDPVRRDRLLFELSDLPVELSDLSTIQANRVAAQNNPDPNKEDPRLTSARQRIDWANRFRAHYAAVAAKAGVAR